MLPNEGMSVFEGFKRLMFTELVPVGPMEEFLAHRVVACCWRLLRVERLEGALDSDRLADAVVQVVAAAEGGRRPTAAGWVLPGGKRYEGLAKLSRHEVAIERSLFRTLGVLRDLQDERRRRERPGKKGPGFVPDSEQ